MARFATPDSQTKSKALTQYFYPASSDASSSVYMQSAENLNKLLSSINSDAQYAQNPRQNTKAAGKVVRNSADKKPHNELSLSSVNTKKQQMRNYTKVGSTNDASTLNYDEYA